MAIRPPVPLPAQAPSRAPVHVPDVAEYDAQAPTPAPPPPAAPGPVPVGVVPVAVPVPIAVAAVPDAPPPLPLPADGGLPIGRHIFEDLSGTAGTGKTWMARELVASQPGVVLTATTGIAAINLGAGTTINALLNYYDTENLHDDYQSGLLQMRLRALRRAGTQRIVLDEKSMLDGEQLTYLVRAIEEINDPHGGLETVGASADEAEALEADRRADASLPPLGLTLIGDFGQLAPVKAPFAFESVMWDRFAAHRTILTKVHRQDNATFINGLQAVRQGDVTTAMSVFTPNLFHHALDDTYEGSTIFAKNIAVARYNQLRLDSVQGPVVALSSTRWGKQRGDWKQIPETLRLKEGALVMILSNMRAVENEHEESERTRTRWRLIYANGDLGIFRGMGGDEGNEAIVELQRTGRQVTVSPITRECLAPLTPERRKALRETGELGTRTKGKYEIVGEVTYTPLRLAWGTTTHKSQGLTLDRCQINLSDGFFKHPGMLFVALSRARTLEGLRLVGTPQQFAARCVVNPVVRPWL